MKKSNVFITSSVLGLVVSTADDLAAAEVPVEIKYDGSDTRIEYVHDELGRQMLRVDKINKDWYILSFVGHHDFLESIESEGWLTSARSLLKFFKETSADHGVDLEIFKDLEEKSFEVGEDMEAVLIHNPEDGDSVETAEKLLDALRYAHGLRPKSQSQTKDEPGSEEEVPEVVIREVRAKKVKSEPEVVEKKEDESSGPSFWVRARRKIMTPTGMVIGGALLAGATTAVVARLLRD